MRRLMGTGMLVLAMSCGRRATSDALPFYRTAGMNPEWLDTGAATSPSVHHIAPFTLWDQRGARITNAAFAGRASIVHFFFTSCGDVCPTTTRNIAAVLRAMVGDQRVQVLSHSVTPAADSVAALRRYADSHGITDARWHLLTGAKGSIDSLARTSYFVRLGSDTTYGGRSIAHSETVLLVDGDGRLRGVYAGSLQLEMDRLREDLATLLADVRSR
jgi:protein SCO1/2